jgi:hypothetical protein
VLLMGEWDSAWVDQQLSSVRRDQLEPDHACQNENNAENPQQAAESPSTTIPKIAVPAAPIPVQTA